MSKINANSLSDVNKLPPFHPAQHKLLALAHNTVVPNLADSHRIDPFIRTGSGKARCFVVAVNAARKAVHAADRLLCTTHVAIRKVLNARMLQRTKIADSVKEVTSTVS